MSDDIRCDDHVGEAYPPRCGACDLERKVAEATVPDFPPIVVNKAEVEAQGAALAEAWRQCSHPSEVAAALRGVVAQSGPFQATIAARLALDEYGTWLIYSCPVDEQRTRHARVFPVIGILRSLAPVEPETTTTRSAP